jgi:hypothetical protein
MNQSTPTDHAATSPGVPTLAHRLPRRRVRPTCPQLRAGQPAPWCPGSAEPTLMQQAVARQGAQHRQPARVVARPPVVVPATLVLAVAALGYLLHRRGLQRIHAAPVGHRRSPATSSSRP